MNLKRFFSADNIFFFGLLLIAVSLSLSSYFMSIGQFVVAFAWLISADFGLKSRKLFSNKAALLLIGIYALHVLGLLWSSDYDYAFKDLRIKLPLLLLPFLLATYQQISTFRFQWVINAFVGAVIVATFISTLVLLRVLKYPVNDIRDISIFISPIRFGLEICLSLFYIGYKLYKEAYKMPFWLKLLLIAAGLWLLCFMLLLETLTGLIIFIIIIIGLLIHKGYHQSKIHIRLVFIVLSVLIPSLAFWYVKKSYQEMLMVRSYRYTAMHTAQGNVYEDFQNLEDLENGYPVWAYVCNKELAAQWTLRSTIPFDGNDTKGQKIQFTLIRFLTSKGLKKDAEGVKDLTNRDIVAIEQGFTNVKYQNISSLGARIHAILWELNGYMRGGDPSGHSVAQRLEYWKTAINIFKNHPIIGIGTGDINEAFANQYEEDGSMLAPAWRLKTHNQYLTFAAVFGILGLAYFLIALFWPLLKDKQHKNFYYLIFFVIAAISMLTEDTLETQAGVTFFAFFSALLLFQQPESSEIQS